MNACEIGHRDVYNKVVLKGMSLANVCKGYKSPVVGRLFNKQ